MPSPSSYPSFTFLFGRKKIFNSIMLSAIKVCGKFYTLELNLQYELINRVKVRIKSESK